jgi:hypothetical protein
VLKEFVSEISLLDVEELKETIGKTSKSQLRRD